MKPLIPCLTLLTALTVSAMAQTENLPLSRTLSIGGVGKEPKYTLRVSFSGRYGLIDVIDADGDKQQTLTCDLFRDYGPEVNIGVDPKSSQEIVEFHGRMFVSGVEAMDVDFDGLPDILAVRDFSAKTRSYCIWLYAGQWNFMQEPLSHQMEELENLAVDPARRLVMAHTIGPVNPTQDEYRISSSAPWRRLLPLRSCMMSSNAKLETTIRVITYSEGQETVHEHAVSSDCTDICGDACPNASASPAKPATNTPRR